MSISYEGIGQTCITMRKMDTVTVGAACAMESNDRVHTAGNDEKFFGIVDSIRGGYAGIIVSGIVTMPYSGSDPTVGHCALAGDGTGKLKCSDEGNSYLVLNVNKSERTVTFII